MGLDQCAVAYKGESFTNHCGETEYPETLYLVEWRKHPNLQGFMQNLCGGRDINGVEVKLTLEDIDALEEAVNKSELPETQGFFFGENSDEYYAEQDREFIAYARDLIKDGYTVFYHSNW